MSAHRRLTDSLLRNLGGRTVLLQMPAPAVPNDAGEQLGLAVPQFQNVALSPAVFRKVRDKEGTAAKASEAEYELLVSATAVSKAAGAMGLAAAEVFFAQAAAVLMDERSFGIIWVASAEAFGCAYLYRLGLRGAIASIT